MKVRINNQIEKIFVKDKKTLDMLYENWAFTMVGFADDERNYNNLTDWINQYGSLKKKRFYLISGAYMNDVYGLSGDVAYSNDINIVCIMPEDMIGTPELCVKRFEIGGKWFTDVVDNNERHMFEQMLKS